MYHLKTTIFMFLLLVFIFPFPMNIRSAEAISEPRPPTEFILELSHAPKLNETTDLVFTIEVEWDQYSYGKIWLEFKWADNLSSERLEIPPSDIFVGGVPDWTGIPTKDVPLRFNAEVRFPKEGFWEITGYYREDEVSSITGLRQWIRSNRVQLRVTKDKGNFGWTDSYRQGSKFDFFHATNE